MLKAFTKLDIFFLDVKKNCKIVTPRPLLFGIMPQCSAKYLIDSNLPQGIVLAKTLADKLRQTVFDSFPNLCVLEICSF